MVTNEFETDTEENFDLKRKSETTRHDGALSNQPRHPDRPSFGDTRLSAYNQTDPSLRFIRAFRGASSPFNRVYGEKSWSSPPPTRQQACRQTNGHASVCPPPLRTRCSHPRKQTSTWEQSREPPRPLLPLQARLKSPPKRWYKRGLLRGSQTAQ